jgi:multidrug resistance efflux pump
MRQLGRWLWIIGVFLTAATVTGARLVMASRSATVPTSESSAPASTAVACFGYVDVDGGVTALYPLQPGRVERVCVRENDEVTAGTVLLRLDARQAEQLVRQAQADLDAAQAQLVRARKGIEQQRLREAEQAAAVDAVRHRLKAAELVLARQQDLLNVAANEKEVAASRERCAELQAGLRAEEDKLEELRLNDPALDVRRAEADVSAKQARLDQSRLALDECQLKAPADGKVLRVQVGPGDVLGPQPARPIVLFCPKAPRIVRAEIPQEFAAGVESGQTVVIHDDTRAQMTWRGKIRLLSDWYTHRRSMWQDPLQYNDVRTLECTIDLDPGQPPLRIGQRVLVQVIGKNQE